MRQAHRWIVVAALAVTFTTVAAAPLAAAPRPFSLDRHVEAPRPRTMNLLDRLVAAVAAIWAQSSVRVSDEG